MKRTALNVRSRAPTADSTPLDGFRKAAILMVLLGDEATSVIGKHLDSEDMRRLRREMAQLGPISPQDALDVLQEYSTLCRSKD